jgi:hypothetical protein
MRRARASSTANIIPFKRDVATESPPRDSREMAACTRFDERSRR